MSTEGTQRQLDMKVARRAVRTLAVVDELFQDDLPRRAEGRRQWTKHYAWALIQILERSMRQNGWLDHNESLLGEQPCEQAEKRPLVLAASPSVADGLTQGDLEKMAARVRGAPWHISQTLDTNLEYRVCTVNNVEVAKGLIYQDAEFIANAPFDILSLLAFVRRLQEKP